MYLLAQIYFVPPPTASFRTNNHIMTSFLPPAVLHFLSEDLDSKTALFVCTVGHEFKCDKKKALRMASRYEPIWVQFACPCCLALVCMGVDSSRLAALAISPPTKPAKPAYIPAPPTVTAP